MHAYAFVCVSVCACYMYMCVHVRQYPCGGQRTTSGVILIFQLLGHSLLSSTAQPGQLAHARPGTLSLAPSHRRSAMITQDDHLGFADLNTGSPTHTAGTWPTEALQRKWPLVLSSIPVSTRDTQQMSAPSSHGKGADLNL